MQNNYIVEIKMKSGSSCYLMIPGKGKERISAVKTKRLATKMNFDIAEIVSDYFYEHKWKQEIYEYRMTVPSKGI